MKSYARLVLDQVTRDFILKKGVKKKKKKKRNELIINRTSDKGRKKK
jgi:hypothetical protein